MEPLQSLRWPASIQRNSVTHRVVMLSQTISQAERGDRSRSRCRSGSRGGRCRCSGNSLAANGILQILAWDPPPRLGGNNIMVLLWASSEVMGLQLCAYSEEMGIGKLTVISVEPDWYQNPFWSLSVRFHARGNIWQREIVNERCVSVGKSASCAAPVCL